MKHLALLFSVCLFTVVGLCQGLQMKNTPEQVYVLPKSTADYTGKQAKTFGKLYNSPTVTPPKTDTDRQLDSVYRNVYQMEVPIFYEPTRRLERK